MIRVRPNSNPVGNCTYWMASPSSWSSWLVMRNLPMHRCTRAPSASSTKDIWREWKWQGRGSSIVNSSLMTQLDGGNGRVGAPFMRGLQTVLCVLQTVRSPSPPSHKHPFPDQRSLALPRPPHLQSVSIPITGVQIYK